MSVSVKFTGMIETIDENRFYREVFHLRELLDEAITHVCAGDQSADYSHLELARERANEIYLALTGEHVARTKPAKRVKVDPDDEEDSDEDQEELEVRISRLEGMVAKLLKQTESKSKSSKKTKR